MAGSTINGTVTGTSSSHYAIKIIWSSTANQSTNQSSVTSTLWFRRVDYLDPEYRSYSDSATTSLTCTGESTFNETGVEYSTYYDTDWIQLSTKTWTVDHNSDGSKSVTLSAAFVANAGSGMTGGTVSGTATLDTIPRGSVIGSISAFNIEDQFSVPITKYSATFEDTLTIKYGSTTIKTISDYEDEDAINLSDSEILAAYNAMGTNMSGTFTFTTTTKSGTTTIGTDSATATGTAKGTMYLNDSGLWKRAVPHLNVGGTWKRCVAYFHDGNNWQRGIG